MGVWKFKFLIFGIAYNNEGKYIIDMTDKTYCVWNRLIKKIYYYNFIIGRTRHFGEYWKHPSLKWYLKYIKG